MHLENIVKWGYRGLLRQKEHTTTTTCKSATVDLTLNTDMHRAKYNNTLTTRCKHILNSPPPALPSHLTTWQSLFEKCCRKRRPLPGEELWLEVRSNAQKKPQLCRIPSWDSNTALMDGPTAQPCPCLLSCFAFYPLLFLWINPLSLCHSTPLFLSFPSLSWA